MGLVGPRLFVRLNPRHPRGTGVWWWLPSVELSRQETPECVYMSVCMFALTALVQTQLCSNSFSFITSTILCVTLSVGSMVTWRCPLSCTPPVTPILWSGKEDCTGPARSQTLNCIGLRS